MEEKEYRITLTEKDKNKLEQVLKLVDIVVNMVVVEDTKESEKFKLGDTYYFIDSDGEIVDDYFSLDSSLIKRRLAMGNCFKTREEAEFELERLKVLTEMKKFAESKNRAWNGVTLHWCMFYDINTNSVQFIGKTEYKYDGIYFKTQEKAKECLETIGEDKIRKYYLQIKE